MTYRLDAKETRGLIRLVRVVELARARQSTLRAAALVLGERVYGDGVDAVVDRLVGPWSGGGSGGDDVGRERTFLVADMPELPEEGTRIRQGYVALDGEVQVRIRDRDGRGRSLRRRVGAARPGPSSSW